MEQAGAAPQPELPKPSRLALTIGAAWLVPGLGHLLLGRVRRAALFAALILGSFGLGLAHDGKVALHDSDQRYLSAFQLIANVGMGPFDFVARTLIYDQPAYRLPRLSDPDHNTLVARIQQRSRSELSNYGSAYLWTAGLMNWLLLFDVWDIGRGRKR